MYYGDQPVATAAEYAQQAAAIALDQPAAKPAAEDWMPLGVFAVTHDGEPTDADPTMFLQLAVSKQGVITGTFQNTATDTPNRSKAWSTRKRSEPPGCRRARVADHGDRHRRT